MTDKPTPGRIVHYVLPDGPSKGAIRPALYIRTLEDGRGILQVFTDGDGTDANDRLPPVFRQAALYDPAAEPALGTWHWPPTNVPPPAAPVPKTKPPAPAA